MGKKIIAIDAGHGMNTAGKRCMKKIDPNQTREWWLNDRIADMVQKELEENYDCVVVRVDDTTGVKDIPLATRTKTANNANADMYISIHHNAGINGGTGGGTVVFYYSSKAERLRQAMNLYNSIVNKTLLFGNRAEYVIFKNFYVLKNTKMPAFLCELGFMDSQVDTPKILTEGYAQKASKGLVEFVVKELKLDFKEEAERGSENVTEASEYYPKYRGAKTTLYNAMESLGIDPSYKHRKLIAKANNITAYVGSAKQNTQMYNLLVAGLLKKE